MSTTGQSNAKEPSLTMSLAALLERYFAAVECGPRYQESLRRTVRKATRYGIPTVCQLTPDAANKFLAGLRLGATTRHNIRRELLTLWRFAFDRDHTDVYPARVRKIRAEYAPVQAWTLPQLDQMLALAEQETQPISRRLPDIKVSDVLPAWIGIAYDSGVRFSDVHALNVNSFRNGCVALTAQKTRKPLVRELSEDTQLSTARLLRLSPDGTLFKWAVPRRRAFTIWREFLDKHHLGGSSKWLRRTVATQLHKQERGSATEFLQHSAEHLAIRHYIDQTQLQQAVLPPPIRKPR